MNTSQAYEHTRSVRIDASLLPGLKALAAKNRRSLSAEVSQILETAIAGQNSTQSTTPRAENPQHEEHQ